METPLHAASPEVSASSFRALADKLREPAWLLRDDASAVHLNPAFREHTGGHELCADGLDWLQVLDEERREANASALKAGLAAGEPFALTVRVRDHAGQYGAFSVDLVPLGAPGLWLATLTPVEPVLHVVHAVSEPSAAPHEAPAPAEDKARRDAQTRLQLALSSSRTGIWEWQVARDELFWSPETFELLRIDPSLFGGKQADFQRILHRDDHEQLWELFERALSRGGSFEAQFRVITGDGEVLWVHNRCVVEHGPDGTPQRVIGTIRDISELQALHAELRASEAKYRALANAMPQIVWTVGADGAFEWINDRWREYTGGESDGDSVRWAFVHPDDVQTIAEHWQVAALTGTVCEFEYRLRGRDGSYRWHLARVVPYFQQGQIERWIATATDIDDRKRAEEALRSSEERARLQAEELAVLMDAVPAAVVVGYDPECRELRGNRFAAELFRTSPGANLSKGAEDSSDTQHIAVLHEGRALEPADLPVQVAARTGIAGRDIELEIAFTDGARSHVLGSAVPLRDAQDRVRGAIGAFVDVTRLKLAEQALRAADRRKDEFLAVLSHELRNPLAPITTAVELLKMRGDGSDPAVTAIERQARHMVRLVDDLLDVSRLARGKVELRRERLELSRAVARAVELTSVLFEQRQHRLTLHVAASGLEVEADEVRLTQVIANLLTNAARFTAPGGYVEVAAEREGDSVVLRVRDQGMGITADLLPHVFEMFVQGPRGPDRAEGGLGLGLALVASLTELHGGTVQASSEGAGRGSTFVLRLPWLAPAPSSVSSPEASAQEAQPSVRRSVLIVDDNGDAAEMLSLMLTRAGFEVRVAHDPPAALAMVQAWRPEFAILDIGLPVMDGHQLARELRQRLGPATPKLIALSGYGQEQDRARSRDSGFAHHLVKPTSRADLLPLLEEA